MWNYLGFKEDVFDTSPLNIIDKDVKLLIGRDRPIHKFLNIISSSEQGILMIEGNQGIGKTSFANVAQFLIESQDRSKFGLPAKRLAFRSRMIITPKLELKEFAFNVVFGLYESIEEYYKFTKTANTAELVKIRKWIHQEAKQFGFGLSLAGYGASLTMNKTLPKIESMTISHLIGMVERLVSDIKSIGLSGCFIVFDDLEQYDDNNLIDLFSTFRESLFAMSNVWWILIGKEGQKNALQALNSRITQRMIKIKLNAIQEIDFENAVHERVKNYKQNSEKDIKSPVPDYLYKNLYRILAGNIEYVFSFCREVCIDFVENLKYQALADEGRFTKDSLELLIKEYYPDNQITYNNAIEILQEIILDHIISKELNQEELYLLTEIGRLSSVNLTTNSNLFSKKFLERMSRKGLLAKKYNSGKLTYRLAGIALIAYDFDFLTNIDLTNKY